MNQKNLFIYLLSILILILSGHYFAKFFRDNTEAPWIWTALYYGVWMMTTMLLCLRQKSLKQFLNKATFHFSLVIPLLFAAIAFIWIFLPNLDLIRWEGLLLMNIIICVFNPFIEEIYWRGLPPDLLKNKWIQYSIASAGFAASHPLILGVNSRGASGWQTFVGAFILGSCWWVYYDKKRSLRWPVFTHFLIDLFGLAAYLLADKVPLIM